MNTHSVKIFENFPQAFAYCELITDENDVPVDYRFLEVNPAFEKLTGLKKENILCKRVSQLLPMIEDEEFDWIKTYGTVALTGESISFKEYFDALNAWYEVTAFSNRKGFFSTFFRDITEDVLDKKALEEIVTLSEACLHQVHETLDYKKVASTIRKITQGRQVEIRLYKEGQAASRQVAKVGEVYEKTRNLMPEKVIEKTLQKGNRVYGYLLIRLQPDEHLLNEEHLHIVIGILGQYFDRQQQQKELLWKNQHMMLIFDHMEFPIYVVDMDTYQILYINQEGKKGFGDVLGKTCWQVLHSGLKEACSHCPIPEFKNKDTQVFKKRREYYHREKGKWFKRTDTIMNWPDGRKVKLTVALDVSDRKKAESQEQRLRTIMANAHDSIIVTDEDFQITYVNKKTEELLGYDRDELIGETVGKIYPQEERNRVLERIIPRLKSGKNYSGEIVTKGKNRRDFLCEISVAPILAEKSGIKGYIGIKRDITERKEMLEALRESKQRYEELAKQSGTVAWEINDQGLYTYVSPVVEDVFGYRPEELVEKKYFYELFATEEKETLKKKFYALFSQRIPFSNFVNATQGKKGDMVIVSTNGLPIFREDGSLKGYRGVDVDITQQVLMEQQRDMEKEKFKATLLSVGDGIIATDRQGNIAVMNQVAEHLTEWSQQEAFGKPFEQVFNIIHERTEKPCSNPANHVLRTGETVELADETALITKTGKVIPIEDSAAPIRGKSEEITGAVIVFRDYSEKRKNEQALQYLSFHDHLTGLYNRRYMDGAIERLDKEKDPSVAVIAVDVNGLKLTNDAYGHHKGDELLKTVALILEKAVKKDSIIARISGDEFVILISQTTPEETETIVERIKSLSRRASFDSVIVSLAIGAAMRTAEDKDLWEVLRRSENRMFKNKVKHGKIMRSKTIETVLRSINLKYNKEQIHTERVSQYSESLGKALGLSEAETHNIKTIGVLHDIGKITVAPEILNKEERLSEEEWQQIKEHPVTGYNILKGVEEYAEFADAVLHHHERWDGKGYPAGLKGKEIPYYARIITVVDAYEAMTAHRSYQKPKTVEEAAAELRRCAGTQFDPVIVEVFVKELLK